ncbi:MAG: Response regulator [Phycisphaerales bacterium]|nr:Response regulator [Phycisphaerales bacterium]
MTSIRPTSDHAMTRSAILIVEDERVARRALAVLLNACGYATHAVASAEEALGLLQDAPLPTFILADLDLPGMNGLDLIGKLRQYDSHFCPILITAADPDRVAPALGAKGISYLQKPLDFAELLNILQTEQMRH